MKKLLFLFALFLLPACGDTIVDDPDWPEYKEKLVIEALVEIAPDSTHVYCNVHRTMPLNQRYDYTASQVNDADVLVLTGGTSVVLQKGFIITPELRQFQYSVSFPTGGDRHFLLSVSSGSKHAQGEIQVPIFRSEPDSLYFTSSADSLYTHIVFREHVLYNLDYYFDVQVYDSAGKKFSYTFGPDWYHGWTPYEGETSDRSIYYKKGLYKTMRYRLHVIDRHFDRLDSGSTSGGDLFDGGGRNPNFDISGDGFGFITYSFIGNEIEVSLP